MNQRAVFAAYLALLLLQVVWHGLLPSPMGSQNWILALVASLPLLLPLRGIAAGRMRSMTWGGFLAVLYFVIGVMEAWSNPAQRIPAIIQIVVSLAYCGLFAGFSRQAAQPAK
ncbi:MAG TPA: DUF2069 domain-containing protein [Xanthomonadales bacterium]|nr:DUF2069 domain-containing protein [Xanthomonadales bacterium]